MPLLASLLLAQATQPLSPAALGFGQVFKDCTEQQWPCAGTWQGISYEMPTPTSFRMVGEDKKAVWSFYCEKDEMTDEKSCVLIGRRNNAGREEPYLMILWGQSWSGPGISVSHGGTAYPGSYDQLRVDEKKMFSVSEDDVFSNSRAQAIVQQLKTGKSLKLRYYDWPYNASHSDEISLSGFANVYSAASFLKSRY